MPGDRMEEPSTSGSHVEGEGVDSIDVAIADALKAQKNRQTGGISSQSFAPHLKSKHLEFAGLKKAVDTSNANTSGDSTSTEELALQPKLADVKFPETPEDQKEQPKSLKKKSGDRQSRRDRESQTSGEAARHPSSSHRSRQQRELDYAAARQGYSALAPSDASGNPQIGLMANPYGASQPVDMSAKAIYRNRQEDLRDPDYQRTARPYGPGIDTDRFRPLPGYYGEVAGYPHMMLPPPYPQPLDTSAVQMMQNLSLNAVHPSEQSRYMQPGMMGGMAPGGVALPGFQGVPYGYLPSGASIPQPVPQPGMQAIGMYNQMPYSYPLAQPYPYIPARGGQQPVMIGPHMPFYPSSLPPQGYNFPIMQNPPGSYPLRPNVRSSPQFSSGLHNLSPQPSSGTSGGTPLVHRPASVATTDKQQRVGSSSSMGSTTNLQGQGQVDKPAPAVSETQLPGIPKPTTRI